MTEQSTVDYRDPEWVAKQLGIDKNAVYRYLDEGRLPGLRLGRKWLISESSLAEFLKREEREQTERRAGARAGAPTPAAKFMQRVRKLITERAKRVITLAHEEALARGQNYLGQEHILVSFAHEPECVAAKMLANLGIDMRSPLEPRTDPGNATTIAHIESLQATKALELALDEARRLRHHYVGTEHLLLGIARARNGIGFKMLESQGVTHEQLRAEMARILALPPAGG